MLTIRKFVCHFVLLSYAAAASAAPLSFHTPNATAGLADASADFTLQVEDRLAPQGLPARRYGLQNETNSTQPPVTHSHANAPTLGAAVATVVVISCGIGLAVTWTISLCRRWLRAREEAAAAAAHGPAPVPPPLRAAGPPHGGTGAPDAATRAATFPRSPFDQQGMHGSTLAMAPISLQDFVRPTLPGLADSPHSDPVRVLLHGAPAPTSTVVEHAPANRLRIRIPDDVENASYPDEPFAHRGFPADSPLNSPFSASASNTHGINYTSGYARDASNASLGLD